MNQLDLEFSINRTPDLFPNATKCMTWQGVKASHETDNSEVIIRADDIYGMIILLAMGLSGALIVLILELLVKAHTESSLKKNLTPGKPSDLTM